MLPELGQMPPGQRRGRRSERLTARLVFSFSVSSRNGSRLSGVGLDTGTQHNENVKLEREEHD